MAKGKEKLNKKEKEKFDIKLLFFPFKTMLKYAPVPFLTIGFFMLIGGFIAAYQATIFQNLTTGVINYLSKTGPLKWVLVWAGVYFGVNIYNVVQDFIRRSCVILTERQLYKKFDTDIILKASRLDYKVLEDEKAAEIQAKMDNPKNSVQESAINLFLIASTLVAATASFIYLFGVNVWCGLIGVFLVLAMVMLQMMIRRKQIEIYWYIANDNRQMWNIEGIFKRKTTQSEIRGFSSLDGMYNLHESIRQKILVKKEKNIKQIQVLSFFKHIIRILCYAGVLAIIGWAIYKRQLEVGVFVGAFYAVKIMISQAQDFSTYFAHVATYQKEIKYYSAYMALPEREVGTARDLPQNKVIQFMDVHFTYPGTEKEILKGISFKLAQGESLALVGRNGSGKSTIIKLIAGLYKPTSGQILVGEGDEAVRISDLSDYARTKLIGFVFQEVQEYSLTLRENIAIGDAERAFEDEKIKEALGRGLAGGVLEKAKGNLDTQMGFLNKQGITFSMGENQRLAIARAVLGDHDFVVLDEPVASLDAKAESDLYESFLKILKSSGAIVISHRLASAKLASKILLLDGGVIASAGTHKQLMKNSALYKKMYQTQAKWYTGEEKEEEAGGEHNRAAEEEV